MPGKKLFALAVLLCTFLGVSATHNRAGEITYVQQSQLTYKFTLHTYTEIGPVDRPDAELSFGDGTKSTSLRSQSIIILPGPGGIAHNIYEFTHTFPGPGNYVISYRDENRNDDVLNMDNSVGTAFYIETFLRINLLLGLNSTPRLLLEPIDYGVVGRPFLHNPAAYDEDGDSLSFKLVPCKKGVDTFVDNYRYPDKANNFASESFSINQRTGEVSWKNPVKEGLYNIAISIEEWRWSENAQKYVQIGYVTRDMQIPIRKATPNNSPQIKAINDTCVLSGSTLSLIISASDLPAPGLNPFNQITLIAKGGPFEKGAPYPVFRQPTTNTGTINEEFKWSPECHQVRREPYQIVFKVTDDADTALHDLKTWLVTVIAQAPVLTLNPVKGAIELNWTAADCENAIGYKLYRRLGKSGTTPGVCETGVSPSSGYTLYKTFEGINTTSFTDDNDGEGLITGQLYCYKITTVFADRAESIASDEQCEKLLKDVPVLTNVSITKTDVSTGTAFVQWSKPSELDTLVYPPPYRYLVYHAGHLPIEDPENFELIKTIDAGKFALLTDSNLLSENLNTLEKEHTYKIEFYAATDANPPVFVGTSTKASSIFLAGSPGDNKVKLSWGFNTPWTNTSFDIYRLNRSTALFDKIATTNVPYYTDNGLSNRVEYCYYITSTGAYPTEGFIDPIVNNSQQICVTAIDNERPCPPNISIVTNCKNTNVLTWTLDSLGCLEDIRQFEIYKLSQKGVEFQFNLIKTMSKDEAIASNFRYEETGLEESVAGKYYIVSLDSAGNDPQFASNVVEVDNCPSFALPNVFTPNGDGVNDLFMPYPDSTRFVNDILIFIYNRWGDLVFTSDYKDINWDGTHYISKKKLPTGVYYYTCDVNGKHIEGVKNKEIRLSGFIYLLAD